MASGTPARPLGALEADRGRPDPQLVAVGQQAVPHRSAVDDRAVGGPEVEDAEALGVAADLGVAAGHLRVAERDVAARQPADRPRAARPPGSAGLRP